MLFISVGEQKRLNRLIQYATKRERRVLAGCKNIFDVAKRYQCQLKAISRDDWNIICSDGQRVRFVALPSVIQAQGISCKIEYCEELQSASQKAMVILELLKNQVDYTTLCKKFHLQDTVEIKDYVSMRIFLSIFIGKNSGVKVVPN